MVCCTRIALHYVVYRIKYVVTMERRVTPVGTNCCINTRSTRTCRMRAAMLVTSLLAGAYVALLRHGRRRTVLRLGSRDHSHDDDVTVEMPTMIGEDWQLHRPNIASTKLDGD